MIVLNPSAVNRSPRTAASDPAGPMVMNGKTGAVPYFPIFHSTLGHSPAIRADLTSYTMKWQVAT